MPLRALIHLPTGLALALFRPHRTINDVAFRHLIVAGPHQLFLNQILNLLDVNRRLPQFHHPPSHRTRDLRCSRGIHSKGQEGLTNRDFNFRLVPRHDLTLSPNQTGGANWSVPSSGSRHEPVSPLGN